MPNTEKTQMTTLQEKKEREPTIIFVIVTSTYLFYVCLFLTLFIWGGSNDPLVPYLMGGSKMPSYPFFNIFNILTILYYKGFKEQFFAMWTFENNSLL